MDSEAPQGMTLLGRFTVTSMLVAAVFAVALGAFVAGKVERASLNEVAATTVQAADSLLSPYLVKGDFVYPLWPARLGYLDSQIAPHLLENGIEQVRLWTTSGVIAYSNIQEQIGLEGTPPPEIDVALSGRPVAVIRGSPNADSGGSALLAVFAPVRLVGAEQPNGVYEINLDAGPILAHIQDMRMRTWLYVVLGTLVLYGSLIGLVYRASRALMRQQSALRAAFEGTIRALATAIDAKDAYTGGHSSEVSQHAEAIARALALTEADVQAVRIAGYLHDLGKIGIPDRLLRKAGPLDEHDWAKMRSHSLIGHRILEPVPIDERIKLAVLHNHERWDGTGYPDGLAGAAIPIHARILMVADAYEAMTSNRPYRPALEPAEAIAKLRQEAGSQFDPEVVRVFVDYLSAQPAPEPRPARVAAGAQPGSVPAPPTPP